MDDPASQDKYWILTERYPASKFDQMYCVKKSDSFVCDSGRMFLKQARRKKLKIPSELPLSALSCSISYGEDVEQLYVPSTYFIRSAFNSPKWYRRSPEWALRLSRRYFQVVSFWGRITINLKKIVKGL